MDAIKRVHALLSDSVMLVGNVALNDSSRYETGQIYRRLVIQVAGLLDRLTMPSHKRVSLREWFWHDLGVFANVAYLREQMEWIADEPRVKMLKHLQARLERVEELTATWD